MEWGLSLSVRRIHCNNADRALPVSPISFFLASSRAWYANAHGYSYKSAGIGMDGQAHGLKRLLYIRKLPRF